MANTKTIRVSFCFDGLSWEALRFYRDDESKGTEIYLVETDSTTFIGYSHQLNKRAQRFNTLGRIGHDLVNAKRDGASW